MLRQLLGVADEDGFLKSVREATDGGFPFIGDEFKARLEQAGVRLEPGKRGPRPTRHVGAEIDQLEISYLVRN
jgi:hypothetical protein